ncbi:MAG: putative DNA binding domain-containing protein [Spirochaetes bacterium]|nr:putative DNA binding domain-containing protein [Spirochaetota bacterium]
MTTARGNDYLAGLVRELCKLPRESEWVEFKVNHSDPQEIGEYLSALSNAAALNGRAFGYLVWGVEDASHEIIGTAFLPSTAKKGNEPLETWLLRLLTPKIHFRFFELTVDGKPVALLEIGRAFRHPVRFQNEAYVRVGPVKKPLKEAPDRERELWRIFDQMPFEDVVAIECLAADEVLRLLDYPAFFDLLEQPLPANRDGILEALVADNLIRPCEAGGWDITNLGAILFAKRLDDFRTLRRKAVRVIQYRGTGRTETLKEQVGAKGYASGFEGLVGSINSVLPVNEVIGQALRKTVPMFPELAVRELVANALIHQDFFVTGAGPMVEIFDDRIEITNPGEPLVDPQRFVDTPPKSRNEVLASLMRRFRICEERGSGIDKVVFQVELFQLPAPLFEVPEGFTRAVLFSHKALSAMDKADRVRACYLHASLRYVTRKPMTNTSVRERFGIAPKNASTASRLLNEAVEEGAIVVEDPQVGTRVRSYLPFWAVPGRGRQAIV